MSARFHDAASGKLVELRPATPPRVALWAECPAAAGWEALRCRIFLSVLKSSLGHSGFVVSAGDGRVGADLSWGLRDRGGLWLKPAPAGGAPAPGLSEADLRYYCLKGHYRRSEDFSAAGLRAAADERRILLATVARLAAQKSGSAPSPTGLAGYKKRFRDALARDLDTAGALTSLWDALKPGALSPASQLAALREADQVLNLGLFQ